MVGLRRGVQSNYLCIGLPTPCSPGSEESPQERRRFIRDADHLVRRLAIELEIELGLAATVLPVAPRFQLAPPQAPLRECRALYADADARRLPCNAWLPCDRPGRSDDAAGNEPCPALVLAVEDEDRVALGDALAAIHRLLCAERKRLRRPIANRGFDRIRRARHLAASPPTPCVHHRSVLVCDRR